MIIYKFVCCVILYKIAGSQLVTASTQWGSDHRDDTFTLDQDLTPNSLTVKENDAKTSPEHWSDHMIKAGEPIKRPNPRREIRRHRRPFDANNAYYGHRKQRRQKHSRLPIHQSRLPSLRNDPLKKYDIERNRERKEWENLIDKQNFNEVHTIDSLENNVITTGVIRTYGKGKVKISEYGSDVFVPRTSGLAKTHRGTITSRVLPPLKHDKYKKFIEDPSRVNTRSRRDCIGCPENQRVIARKGETYVVLPEPCPSLKWEAISGPKPGMKLREGRHHLIGRLGYRRKVCRFQYQVVVIHCKPLIAPELDINCTADDAWGSQCDISCLDNQLLVGPNSTECNDDLQWSNVLPKCKKQTECIIPSYLTQETLHCTTGELLSEDTEFLPEGSVCRYECNDEKHIVECRNGVWNQTEPCISKHEEISNSIIEDITTIKNITDTSNENNALEASNIGLYNDASFQENDESEEKLISNHCQPNPCQNGGTCLISADLNNPLCLCPNFTTGEKCQHQVCEEDYCLNGGHCLITSQKMTCYCTPEYTGSKCQFLSSNLERKQKRHSRKHHNKGTRIKKNKHES